LFTGEDYELLFTVPADLIANIDPTVRFTAIGDVREHGVLIDNERLPDRGYEH